MDRHRNNMFVPQEHVRTVVRDFVAGERSQPVSRPGDGHNSQLDDEEDAVADVPAGYALFRTGADYYVMLAQICCD